MLDITYNIYCMPYIMYTICYRNVMYYVDIHIQEEVLYFILSYLFSLT